MKLCSQILSVSEQFKNLIFPTVKPLQTGIVHFGVGAFHRSHQALYTQKTMEHTNELQWGILGAGIVVPYDKKMNTILNKQNFLYMLVEKDPSQKPTYRIINSIINHIYAPEALEQLVEQAAAENVKIITLTITEGGYFIKQDSGEFDITHPKVTNDAENWNKEKGDLMTVFGYLAKIMDRRMKSGGKGLTILSCDNIQHNGDLAAKSFFSFLIKACKGDLQLLNWVKENCSFPNSMVDRITPQTLPSDIEDIQKQTGIIDQWPVISQSFTQWIVEDKFSQSRPKWETSGVIFVDDVTPYEKMKLRVLNGSHQALCYLGALHGYKYVHEAAKDHLISQFVGKYLKNEVMPVLGQVPGINLEEYQSTVMSRFGNPHVKDTLSRICQYASDRIPIFNVPSMLAMQKDGKQIPLSAMIIASWILYVEGVSEHSQPLPLQDNRKQEVCKYVQEIAQGKEQPSHFLRLPGAFANLKESPQFCQQVDASYKDLKTNKVMGALQHLL